MLHHYHSEKFLTPFKSRDNCHEEALMILLRCTQNMQQQALQQYVMFYADNDSVTYCYLLTGAFNAKYDLIVLDESESLLAHLDEGTMEGKAIATFEFLDELLRLSSKVICLDGDMSDRTLSLLGSYGSSVRYVRNVAKAEGKAIRVMRDPEAFRLEDRRGCSKIPGGGSELPHLRRLPGCRPGGGPPRLASGRLP
jgi:hypothetical protein